MKCWARKRSQPPTRLFRDSVVPGLPQTRAAAMLERKQGQKESLMKRHGYTIGGQVQGVGFRPFVYRVAARLQLTGHVGNTSEGVRVEVQGTEEALTAFAQALEHELPPLARITALHRETLPPAEHETDFTIRASEGRHGHAVLVSPDVATCANCLADMRDPANRRYRYPFTNCTDCGPRYTITRSIPYDRASTTMHCFPLCPECAAEYHDPLDRRFHAQPNACPACGPHVWLIGAEEAPLAEGAVKAEGWQAPQVEDWQVIVQAAAALHAGRILAAKGLGGFHLICDAANPEAIARLRERKRRPHKALAIMVPDLETARRVAVVSETEAAVLTSPEHPITVLDSRHVLPRSLAPDVDNLGVMLPYTPLHHLLLEAFAAGSPLPALVMTSGNAGGEPIALGNREALSRLRPIADVFLLHNRDILIRADDSVLRVEEEDREAKSQPQEERDQERLPERNTQTFTQDKNNEPSSLASPRLHLFRRARGFVPRPLPLPQDPGCSLLATGAELKNTLCLTRGKEAFVSQHVGDLKNLETFAFFRDMARHLETLLEVRPEAVVCDLHPDYLSTAYALESGLPVLRLQHHFAHIYSVLAENEHDAPALGLALDGTGYGPDGTIWGGELLFVDPRSVSPERWGGRIGRLAPFPLPGGEAAIREPWRIASGFMGLPEAASLRERFADTLGERLGITGKEAVHAAILELVRRGAAPLTSSCGRLFDAVAALLGLCPVITYEGQAAIRLEACQDLSVTTALPCSHTERNGLLELDTAGVFLHLLELREQGVPLPVLARRFHLGLVEGLADLALAGARRCGVRAVGLSGGVLHNRTVSLLLPEALARRGLVPLRHRALPPGDGGIAFGQAAWASRIVRASKT